MAMSLLMKNKRGFFLTLIALMLVALFFLYLQIGQIRQHQPAQIANSALSTSVSSFVSSMEKFYLPNIAAVSLRASLVGMTKYLAGSNQYISQANQNAMFYQLMTNGTMYPYNNTIFVNDTLNSLLPSFASLVSSQLNIPLALNYTPYQFTVTQNDPWTVTVKIIFMYSINMSDIVLTNRTLQVFATVPITGLSDPYFLINNRYNVYSPNITRTNITTWNIANLKQQILTAQFAADPQAPSYLNRLANLTTASPYGIETFVDPSIFGFNVTEVNYSFVDYQFWTRPWNCVPSAQNLFEIKGISDTAQLKYFRIDDAHLGMYINSTERSSNTTLVCSS